MTQIYITIGIIVLILVCHVFIRQTISERQQEKERLQRILTKRAKDLLKMTSTFPEHFLPKEIVVFIYRCIIDAYTQLTKLNPNNTEYVKALKVHTEQLENTVRTPERKHCSDLQSTTQINELKQYLNLLNSFLQKSLQRQHISTKQHNHYRMLVKELIIRLAINNYMILAKQSLDIQKIKLALHYYDLAKKLLIKETPTDYQKYIEDINIAAEPLLKQEAIKKGHHGTTHTEKSAEDDNSKEWEKFEEDAGWKKKNIYD